MAEVVQVAIDDWHKPNEESLKLFESLNDLKSLRPFNDCLSILSKLTEQKIGDFAVSASQVVHQEHALQFLKQFDTHVTGIETFISRRSDHYVIQQVQTAFGQEMVKKSFKVALQDVRGFISEGANLLLLKLLAISDTNFGQLQLLTIDHEARFCIVRYDLLERNPTSDLCTISRSLLHKKSATAVWQSCLSLDGRFVSHVQHGAPVYMKQSLEKDRSHCPAALFVNGYEQHSSGKNGMISSAEMKSYIRQHPEIGVVISNFWQFLFLHKPSDVFSFAAEHFKSMKLVALVADSCEQD